MKRVGVFVCHCGLNIAGNVNIKEVVDKAGKQQYVVFANDHKYLCSEPGQSLIKNSIRQHHLDAIVVAVADAVGGAAVLTTDPRDLRALARHAAHDVRISPI
jgi:heterodisulfide reductase subunit A-like polyferredoxin